MQLAASRLDLEVALPLIPAQALRQLPKQPLQRFVDLATPDPPGNQQDADPLQHQIRRDREQDRSAGVATQHVNDQPVVDCRDGKPRQDGSREHPDQHLIATTPQPPNQ